MEPVTENWRDRCDWCRFPLAASIEDGCVADDCSMRPRPTYHSDTAVRQECRKAQRDRDAALARVMELEAELDDLKAAIGVRGCSIDECKRAITCEEEEIDKMQDRIGELISRAEKAEAELREAGKTVWAREAEIDALSADARACAERVIERCNWCSMSPTSRCASKVCAAARRVLDATKETR